MGKKPAVTKAMDDLKSTPRGTYNTVPVYVFVREPQDGDRVYKTFKCRECGVPIAKNSHRLVCYVCDHAEDTAGVGIPPAHQSPAQRHKAQRRERKATLTEVAVRASGVSPEELAETVDGMLEELGYA